ncbi:glycosyltransferase [Rhodococcus sp. 14-2483-1-2]|uniref:glycosyltransferase n=1 Tax=Rhodococcus sp. 14-2483-1-2 TaxID=2023147 RepID=UPI00207B2CC7|nr:glycosyltransferase [Rhodococcus sp. 14-2483-1-2]
MHTAHPSISVIIPVGSLDPLLDAQLQALAEQDVDCPFDVLISDNAGDGRVSDHVASHPLRDRLQLTCVDASQQVGAAHARNRGAESASGDLLAFCDSDDVVHTSWLTTLVQKASSFDVVGTAVETVTLNSARALSWTPTTEPEKQGRTDFLPFAIGASMACWASVYRDLGGMDNRFRASQDVEFSWRAQLAGYTLGFSDEPVVAYRLRAELRPMLRQSFRLGFGFSKLRGIYRPQGCPALKVRRVASWWMALLLRNPLLPTSLTGMSRGHWLRAFVIRVGELRAGIRYGAIGW